MRVFVEIILSTILSAGVAGCSDEGITGNSRSRIFTRVRGEFVLSCVTSLWLQKPLGHGRGGGWFGSSCIGVIMCVYTHGQTITHNHTQTHTPTPPTPPYTHTLTPSPRNLYWYQWNDFLSGEVILSKRNLDNLSVLDIFIHHLAWNFHIFCAWWKWQHLSVLDILIHHLAWNFHFSVPDGSDNICRC